jgi:hypothetical protein
MGRLTYGNRIFQEDLRNMIMARHADASMSWSILTLGDYQIAQRQGSTSSLVKASILRGDDLAPILVEVDSARGPLDAFFGGVLDALLADHPSLSGIALTSYTLSAKMDVAVSGKKTDVPAVVTIGVSNNRKEELIFGVEDVSMVHAGLDAVLYAVEFFVNAEMAFRRLHSVRKMLGEVRDTARLDGVTIHMANLLRIAHYAEAIKTRS